MKNLLFTTLLLFCKVAFTQNLVNNWSFEDTVSCPDNLGQISRVIGWSSFRETPDYFNSCNGNNSSVSIPLNLFDYQQPRTGEAYSGFFTKSASLNTREYIGTQLNQPLTIGNSYFVSIFVNRVGTSSGQHKNIGTNKIGVRFSTISYSVSNPLTIDNFAHIYTDSIVSDTLDWTEISGFLFADSSYQYLSIGNFFQDSLTSYVLFDPNATAAYYFVDDITVIDSIPMGLNEYHTSFIESFPNPARDWIQIRGNGIKEVSIFDVLGNLCYRAADSFVSPYRINITKFENGIYILQLKSANQNITKKLIKL